ncbi:glycosyltransferase family 2 protein [Streptomyces phaeochromogenes]|uniref:glycosyltransferase family 2 protein n=1 Tax=Streptomyces phaeochromogenes TaxID=1923 RepID=UPI0033D792EC
MIIPVYDSELYLESCLDSVAGQTLSDIEVILVDDGSTDASRDLAEEYTHRDSRFRLVCQENRGSGEARNTGLQQATGRYLAFSDCDDIVAEDAYERLVNSLRETNSDIACGGVRRFNREGEWSSPLHKGIFDAPRRSTHITRYTSLLGDRTVWNKVYRRSFWDEKELVYAEHPFEDGCLTVRAHVLARAVDVLSGPVYFWRQRDEGPLSTTQRVYDLSLLDGRMQQVRTISGFLGEHSAHLKRAYDLVALDHDLLILLTAVPHVAPTVREEILAFTVAFCEKAEQDVFKQLDHRDQECYSLLRAGRVEELMQHLLQRPDRDFL